MNSVKTASDLMINTNNNKPILNKKLIEKIKNVNVEKIEKKNSKYSIKTKEEVEKFEEILDITNKVMFGNELHYEIKVHEKTGTIMSKLVNTDTGEILREIPSEKILDMIAGLWEIAGIIIDEQA